MSSVVVELNVGGTIYATTIATLTSKEDSILFEWFGATIPLQKDSHGRYFIDRDGPSFRYILDYLRENQLILPEDFQEKRRLELEAAFYRLPELIAALDERKAGSITLGYQGSFYFGRQGMGADVSFRKVSRLLASGKVNLCREVFGDTLNEGRDPDRGHEEDRYTSRFFLKHNSLEQAFDALTLAGYKMVGSAGSGTSSPPVDPGMKPGVASTEEERWAHYNEFVFVRN